MSFIKMTIGKKFILALTKGVLLFVLGAIGAGTGLAQEKSNDAQLSDDPPARTYRAMGGGIGLWHVPEDADFERNEASPLEVFVDLGLAGKFMKLRAGLNYAQSQMELSILDKPILHTLTTQSIYLAYRYSTELNAKIETFAIAGMAYMLSELKFSKGLGSESSSGIGMIFGLGVLYNLEPIEVGMQYILLTRNGEFRGVSLATGSNQVQLIARRQF
ncbi:hypothetical protein WDW89_25935 [Deltaproteobacteria bacterium TL4]